MVSPNGEIICTVYRSSREREMYLFVNRSEGLARVPQVLLDKLGTTSEVMTIKLGPERKLARAQAPDVLAAISANGFYLQLPPDKQVTGFTEGE
jgi:uncharacterized protein YcgL (UPF0745 family)